MFVFRVVDLASQAKAFLRYSEGWSREDMLAWLRLFGIVKGKRKDYFVFNSPTGLQTSFILTESAKLWIVGDHTIYDPLK